MPFNLITGVFTRIANSFSNPVATTIVDEVGADGLFDDYDNALTYLKSSASWDNLLGSTPGSFAVRGASVWSGRAIVGADLPNPTTITLGGVFALPVAANDVLSGIDVVGQPTRATTTGSGNVVKESNAAILGAWTLAGSLIITGQNSGALTVGRTGATAPALQVDTSAPSSVTGLKLTAQAAGVPVSLGVISSAGDLNVDWLMDAKGTGGIHFGITSTGAINFWRNANFLGPGTATFWGTTSGSTILKANATASGTCTLPAAVDTLVGKATTDTLTNKTFDTGAFNTFRLNGADFGTEAQVLAALHNPVQIYSFQVDLNTVGDTAIPIVLPQGKTIFQVNFIRVVNTSNTASLNTAQVGVHTASGGGGTQIVTDGASLAGSTTNADNTNSCSVQLTLAVGASAKFTANPLYFRVTTGQGAGAGDATVTVIMQILAVK